MAFYVWGTEKSWYPGYHAHLPFGVREDKELVQQVQQVVQGLHGLASHVECSSPAHETHIVGIEAGRRFDLLISLPCHNKRTRP